MVGKNLNHPNIVKYNYMVKTRKNKIDEFHIIMELIKGKNLKSYIEDKGPATSIRQI